MKILSLTSDEPHHECLISLLATHFNLTAAIVEPVVTRRRRLRREGKWRSYAWFTYHAIRREMTGLNSYRRRFFRPRTDRTVMSELTRIEVDFANSPRVLDAVASVRPDLLIVCGTSILTRETLSQCRMPIINVHGGYLPFYRGNHCFFFACYEGRLDRVGSSIHFVNEGIDTGDLIDVVSTTILPVDTPESLYCRCEWIAFHRLIEIIRAWEAGTPPASRPQPQIGRTFRMRDRTIFHDLAYLFTRHLSR